jgi:predicted aspartyl protease
VEDIAVKARVDSGVEITILSTQVYDRLKKKPKKVKDVEMQLADKEAVLKGFTIKPLRNEIGSQIFKERVYVAPINDEMLLGHDLLQHLGVMLDMQLDMMLLNRERIPMTTKFRVGKPVVARVTVATRIVVPPNAAVRVVCNVEANLGGDYFIESEKDLSVLMPQTVRSSRSKPVLC